MALEPRIDFETPEEPLAEEGPWGEGEPWGEEDMLLERLREVAALLDPVPESVRATAVAVFRRRTVAGYSPSSLAGYLADTLYRPVRLPIS